MRRKDLAMLTLLAAIWGVSFLFVRIAVPVLGPVILISLRVALAGGALLVFAGGGALTSRARAASFAAMLAELRRRWFSFLLLGAINAALPYTLIAIAELHISASFAAILNATTPMCGAVVAAIWIHDPLTPRKLLGSLLGVLGVGILLGWSPLPLNVVTLLAGGASLLAALCYGIGGVYAKRAFAGVAPLTSAVGQQIGATAALLPFVVLARPSQTPSLSIWLVVLALALFPTAVAYLLFFRLMASVGPTRTLSTTLLVPVFAVLWGVIFLHDQIGPGSIIGMIVVLLSVTLVTGLGFPIRTRARPQSQHTPASTKAL